MQMEGNSESQPASEEWNRKPSGGRGNRTSRDAHLSFESRFESGNLNCAKRIHAPESVYAQRQAEDSRSFLEEVDQTYDMWCNKDTQTRGNIQWYYFSVKNNKSQQGLTVRFNLVNMMKKDSLYNFGMKPCIYSKKANGGEDLQLDGPGWSHGGTSICYHKNRRTYTRRKGAARRHYYTLTFTYKFEQAEDTVFFAHCYPYTYSDLQKDIRDLEQKPHLKAQLRRRDLCRSIAGNHCDLLTITAETDDPAKLQSRAAVVISARVHPGESNASWMMRGVIRYLCSDDPGAALLKEKFVFKLIPMLNPDGVINGNYRTDLTGEDLNRRYSAPTETVQPTISAAKELLRDTNKQRGVFLYVDMHGHSRKKNIFVYGCDGVPIKTMLNHASASASEGYGEDDASNSSENSHKDDDPEKDDKEDELRVPEPPEGSIFPRVFPTLLDDLWGAHPTEKGFFCPERLFSARDCSYSIRRDKWSTGRVVAWRELGIRNSFTLEASFCGAGDNLEQKRRLPPNTVPTENSAQSEPDDKKPAQDAAAAPVKEEKDRDDEDSDGGQTIASGTPDDDQDGYQGGGEESDCPVDGGKKQMETHFSIQDLEMAGQCVCEALLHYCSMVPLLEGKKSYGQEKAPTNLARQPQRDSMARHAPNGSIPPPPIHIMTQDQSPWSSDWVKKPVVMDRKLAQRLGAKGNPRARAEMCIRQELKQRMAAYKAMREARKGVVSGNDPSIASVDDIALQENSEPGSDSDPSGDNLARDKLLNSPIWMALLGKVATTSKRRVARKKRKARKKKPASAPPPAESATEPGIPKTPNAQPQIATTPPRDVPRSKRALRRKKAVLALATSRTPPPDAPDRSLVQPPPRPVPVVTIAQDAMPPSAAMLGRQLSMNYWAVGISDDASVSSAASEYLPGLHMGRRIVNAQPGPQRVAVTNIQMESPISPKTHGSYGHWDMSPKQQIATVNARMGRERGTVSRMDTSSPVRLAPSYVDQFRRRSEPGDSSLSNNGEGSEGVSEERPNPQHYLDRRYEYRRQLNPQELRQYNNMKDSIGNPREGEAREDEGPGRSGDTASGRNANSNAVDANYTSLRAIREQRAAPDISLEQAQALKHDPQSDLQAQLLQGYRQQLLNSAFKSALTFKAIDLNNSRPTTPKMASTSTPQLPNEFNRFSGDLSKSDSRPGSRQVYRAALPASQPSGKMRGPDENIHLHPSSANPTLPIVGRQSYQDPLLKRGRKNDGSSPAKIMGNYKIHSGMNSKRSRPTNGNSDASRSIMDLKGGKFIVVKSGANLNANVNVNANANAKSTWT